MKLLFLTLASLMLNGNAFAFTAGELGPILPDLGFLGGGNTCAPQQITVNGMVFHTNECGTQAEILKRICPAVR